MPIIRECLICKKEFKTFPCKIKTGKGKFCSKKCFYINKKKFYVGEKLYNWKGNSVGIPALHCWVRKHYGRPQKCEDCGTTNPNKRYEWANISGGYRRDIKDFKRLCKKCHVKFDIHLFLKGSKNGNAKLTEKDVVKIRKLYVPFSYSLRKLSKEFNVGSSTINRIICEKNWKHI